MVSLCVNRDSKGLTQDVLWFWTAFPMLGINNLLNNKNKSAPQSAGVSELHGRYSQTMGKNNRPSYLELSVLAGLRETVLSPLPVVVFSKGLKEVIWANATGAPMFGGKGVADLLALKIPARNPIMRQLHHAVGKMGKKKSLTRGFRITHEKQSQLLQFRIEKISLAQREKAIKLTYLGEQGLKAQDQTELAQSVVSSLEGFASAAAVFGKGTNPIAHSPEFMKLAPEIKVIARLMGTLADESDRLVKQLVETPAGQTVAIGLGRISNKPPRSLVVIAAEEIIEPSGDANLQARSETDKQTADAPDSAAIRDTKVEQTLPTAGEPFTGQEEDDDQPIEIDLSPLKETEQLLSRFREEEKAISEASTAEKNIEDQLSEIRDGLSTEDTKEVDNKRADFKNQRFAWVLDAENVFTAVSDDLIACVGVQYGNIEGRKWDNVASDFGLDPNGDITELLAKRDTWSARIVMWPCEPDGSDRVPVELAALPAFNTDREFNGFRGFGKFLAEPPVEEAEDPSIEAEFIGNSEATPALGAGNDAFLQSLATYEETVSREATTADDDNLPDEAFIDEAEPDIRISGDSAKSDDEPPEQSNIVPFSRSNRSSRKLTDEEFAALSAVRHHLTDLDEDPNIEEPSFPQERMAETSLLQKLPVAVLIYRNDEIVFANQHFLKTSGHENLTQLRKTENVSTLLDAIATDGEKSQTVLRKADGSNLHISPILHTVPWEGERAILMSFAPALFVTETDDDVNDDKRAEEIQSILDTTNDGIILMEADGSVISINSPAEALFGIEFDDAIGKPLDALFAAESRKTIRGYLSNISYDGIERLINDGAEVIAQEAKGGFIPVFLTVSKMQSTGKLCAVLRDITSWKKTEEELIQSQREAERSSEQKSEFLAKVSHEIRTPLNAIIGFSDVMIEERFGPIENDRYREYILDIKRSGSHVLEIVNGLLDLSRIEAGKLDLSFEAVDLNEVIAETVALLQPEANINRTIIRTSLSRSVPKVVADSRSIRQIILNLVSNAIKYSDQNSQVIVSTVYENNGEVALRVRDTGQGMTPEQVEKALEPFRQVHDTNERQIEGSGLGLPLTKALTEANRAYFELESQPGQGTIAHIQFPTQRVLSE